jgi:hypothetical protein
LIITPSLPAPVQTPKSSDRSVESVRPVNRARDALDGSEARREPPRQPASAQDHAAFGARAEAVARPFDPSLPARVSRALNAYADVSGEPERSRLRSLLGFDDFA